MMEELQYLGMLFCSGCFIAAYFLLFLVLKYTYKKTLCICFAAILFINIMELLRIEFWADSAWMRLVTTVIQIIIIQGTAFIISAKMDGYSLFMALSTSVFVISGSVANQAIVHWTGSLLAGFVGDIVINLLVLIWLTYTVKDICKYTLSQGMPWQMCFVPASLYVTFYLLLYFPVNVYERPENLYAAFAMLCTAIILYTLVLAYVNDRLLKEYMVYQNYTLGTYTRGLNLRMDEINETNKKIRIMKHDFRHTENLLLELIQTGHYQEAEDMLRNDISRLDGEKTEIFCENVAINSVLGAMSAAAKSMNIRMKLLADVPREQNIEDKDLAVVIANLLENALWAVKDLEETDRFIELKIRNIKGEQIILEVKNPCYVQVEFSQKTGLPVSQRGEEHGLGMISIQDFADRHQAVFDCYLENKIFVVRILVSLK